MMDAASGGALLVNTSDTARHLISTMIANSQQVEIRTTHPMKNDNEVSVSNLECQNFNLVCATTGYR